MRRRKCDWARERDVPIVEAEDDAVLAGAEVDAKDEYKETPLHLASMGGNLGAARLLVEALAGRLPTRA